MIWMMMHTRRTDETQSIVLSFIRHPVGGGGGGGGGGGLGPRME